MHTVTQDTQLHRYTFVTVELHVCENLLQAQLLFSINLLRAATVS